MNTAIIGTAGGLRFADDGQHDPLDGAAITAIHPAGDDLWVLVARRDLYCVRDGVADFVTSLPQGAEGICAGTHDGAVWVGGDEARLWRLDGKHLEQIGSFQAAPTQPEWHTPWGGPPDVFSMASDGTDLYVSVHVGGILRSGDGESWVPTIDLHDDVHQVAVGRDGDGLGSDRHARSAESRDRGATWRYHTAGLHATYLLTVAVASDAVLVGASSGHAGRDGAIYRFDGDRFRRAAGLPDRFDGAVGPRQLAAAGDRAIVALPNGDVYTSDDGGLEWTPLVAGLPRVSELAIHG